MIYTFERKHQTMILVKLQAIFKKILINPYYLLLYRYSILSFTKFLNIGHQNFYKTMNCCKVQYQKQKHNKTK